MGRYIVTLDNDPDAENPLEYDGWKVISFSTRHINFEHPENYVDRNGEAFKIGLRRKLKVGTAFVLGYYEHSGSEWSLMGEGMQCDFDSVRVAGIMIWEDKIANLGPKTYADRAQDARNTLEVYNSWCNGNCYCYSIEDAETGETVDSCCGFYSEEDVMGAVGDYVNKGDEVTFEGDAAWIADYHSLPDPEPTEKELVAC